MVLESKAFSLLKVGKMTIKENICRENSEIKKRGSEVCKVLWSYVRMVLKED